MSRKKCPFRKIVVLVFPNNRLGISTKELIQIKIQGVRLLFSSSVTSVNEKRISIIVFLFKIKSPHDFIETDCFAPM